MANYLDKRKERIKEIFDHTIEFALGCKQLNEGDFIDDICEFCDNFLFCKKVFEEEKEG